MIDNSRDLIEDKSNKLNNSNNLNQLNQTNKVNEPFSSQTQDNSSPNDILNKPKMNSVQKTQHTFGSAFGPDTKHKDCVLITGELDELSGSIGEACQYFLSRLVDNPKFKDKVKSELEGKLKNLFGIARDGLLEKDLLSNLIKLYEMKDNDVEVKNANKAMMKYNNDKHRNWMTALRKVLF